MKYHNTKVQTDVGVFDSKKEYKRWLELDTLQKAGTISDLKRQVPFTLIPTMPLQTPRMAGKRTQRTEKEVIYVADFTYHDHDGNYIVEDVKGVKTKEYILKRKMMLWKHNIQIKEV